MNGIVGAQQDIWLSAYPAGVDWSTPISEQPLTDRLDQTVQLYGTNRCIEFLGKSFSYEDVGDLANRAAKGLQELGVGKGVKVGLLLPNSPYSVIGYYAILKAGGTVVNFNPLYVAEEIERQIADSDTRVMITMDLELTLPKVTAALGRTGLEHVVVCSMADGLPLAKGRLFKILDRRRIARVPDDGLHLSFAELTDNDGAYRPVAIVPREDIAVLQYTGGTTGEPLGAMLSHANIAANAHQVALWNPALVPGGERILGVLPLFHVFAMTAVMNLAVATGAEMVLLPRFDVGQVLKAIRRRQPTQFPGVPTLFNALLQHRRLNGDALRSLEFCISGGAPLPGEIRRAFEALTGCRLVEGYGLSEASPVVTCNPVGETVKEGSVGLVLPGTVIEIRALDDPRRALGPGEKGEICVSGPQVMAGYWRRPEATAKVLREGWVHTGDVGYVDEDGYLFLIDRLKDVILCSGYNVYPRIIEEAIHRHPAVAEVTVCGVPDAHRGEVPKAFVRLKDAERVEAEELLTFLADKLSPIEMPRQVEFRDGLPKTLIGKLSKKELVAEEQARAAGTRIRSPQAPAPEGRAGDAPKPKLYSVTELAEELGVTPRALRFYEDKGLIAPQRAGKARVYTHRDRGRMMLILRGKRLGFSLREVRDWLDLYDLDPDQFAQMTRLQDKVRRRIAALERQRADLDATLAELRDILRQVKRHLAGRRPADRGDGAAPDP